MEAVSSTFNAIAGYEWIYKWEVGLFIILIYSPIVWVRNLASFKQIFILAVSLMVLSVISISTYALTQTAERGWTNPPGYTALNSTEYWNMIGFAFFIFEGIGCLMPICAVTEEPAKFPYLVATAIALQAVVFILFSEICYYTWGDGIDDPVVMEMLPASNTWVQLLKFLYCINLVCSYPLSIYPTNMAI